MYCHWRFSRKMTACKPYTAASIARAITGTGESPMATVTIKYTR